MSNFASLDTAENAPQMIEYLDAMAGVLPMKHYTAGAHASRKPHGFVLDLGCGGGHDLQLLSRAGVRCVGVDFSALALAAAADRLNRSDVPLVQAAGARLPFRDQSLAGCRIERVLMHVEDPPAVLREVVRCLAPGGLISVYEPDWSTFTVQVDGGEQSVPWFSTVRHPTVGGDVAGLLEGMGCQIRDRVEELSHWLSLATLDHVQFGSLASALQRAIQRGHLTALDAERWLDEQRARDALGEFRATLSKTLVVATAPGA